MNDDYKLKLLKQQEEFNKKYKIFEDSFYVKHMAQNITYIPTVYFYPVIDAYYALSSFYHTIEHTEYIVLKFQQATKTLIDYSIEVNKQFEINRPVDKIRRGAW